MKKMLIAAALISVAGMAMAQTSAPALGQPGSLAEVYGVIDTGLAGQSNASLNHGSQFGLSQGVFNGSRWGVRGTEDLGIGMGFKAIYALESGFILPTGYSDQQGIDKVGTVSGAFVGSGQLFGRQAWLGVSSDFGKLTIGRNYGLFTETIGAGDVFGTTHGNWTYANGNNYGNNVGVNGFFQKYSGQRWDNSIRYDGNFSGVTVGLNTALSGYPDKAWYNDMYAGSIGYNSKDFPVSGSIGGQVEANEGNTTAVKPLYHTNFGGGAKYAIDATDAVYAFYFHSSYNSGFSNIDSNNSELGQGTTSLARIDDVASLAGNYYVLPQLNLIGAYYYNSAKNVLAKSDKATRNSVLLTADYYFTKNFDVYAAGAFTSFTGAFGHTANGGAAVVDTSAVAPSNPQNSTVSGTLPNGKPVTSSVDFALGARLRF